MGMSKVFCLELETFALVYGWFCAIFSSFGIIVSSMLFPLAEDHFMAIDKTCECINCFCFRYELMSHLSNRLQCWSQFNPPCFHFVVPEWFSSVIWNRPKETFLFDSLDYSTLLYLYYLLDNIFLESCWFVWKRSAHRLAICSYVRHKCDYQQSCVLHSHRSLRSLQKISWTEKLQEQSTWRKFCCLTKYGFIYDNLLFYRITVNKI